MNPTSYLVDIRQTYQYTNFIQKIGWRIIQIDKNSVYVFLKKLPILPFSVAKILRCNKVPDEKQLSKIRNKYHCLFIKIHPFITQNLNNLQFANLSVGKFKQDNNPLIPTKTIWIDLTKTKQQLLKSMKQKTRYNIKQSLKKNLRVKIISGDKITNIQLENFYNLWKINKPYNWFLKPNLKELNSLVNSFGKNCFFILVWELEVESWKLIAGLLVLHSKNMSFYWHNCSSKEGKARFAPTLCVWRAILESKKRGLEIFDFEGIWDKRYESKFKGWKGFSKFKTGFGGQKIEYSFPVIIK